MEKTVVYRLKLDGIDTAIQNMAQLKELQKQYTQELERPGSGLTGLSSFRATYCEKLANELGS